MLKLTKSKLILFGLGIIFLIYSLDRFRHIIGSEKITGTFAFYIEEVIKEEKVNFPIIEYTIKDSTYQFRAKENTEYAEGESVSVLLENNNPNTPLLYDINSFWLYPLFYFLLPVLIWVSFSLSYIDKNERLEIGFKSPFFRKTKKS
ncbi:hypothetical protein BH10BAC1_BH10BAC1_06290 [soil metagenome]